MLAHASIPLNVTYVPYRARNPQTISTLASAPLMLREFSSEEAPVAVTMEHHRRPGLKYVRRLRGTSLFAPVAAKAGIPPLSASDLKARLADPAWVARFLQWEHKEGDSTLPAKLRRVIDDGSEHLRSATAALSRILIIDGFAYRPALEPAFVIRSFLGTWSADTAAPLQRRNASVGVHFSIRRSGACLEALREMALAKGEVHNEQMPPVEFLADPCWPMFPEAVVNARNLLYELKVAFDRYTADYVMGLENFAESTAIERKLQSALSSDAGEDLPAEAISLAESVLRDNPALDGSKITPLIKSVSDSVDFVTHDEAPELADLAP
ncbi:hypothetical protein [Bosea sp. ANAM02]|uniref:hypothetical protein n=1 Tax=Bosea sp. ANAM02 TaxID=2020412 RepID=UPI00140F4307|nr:hypothetical protein [Bosea sp. ANAM02]BCB22541.1 hypothetical protein OCUBac02_54350 [Bosea sp. ANAM02]